MTFAINWTGYPLMTANSELTKNTAIRAVKPRRERQGGLRPSWAALKKLGVVSRLMQLSGVDRSMSTPTAVIELCQEIAASFPCPTSTPVVEAVKRGRRTVAYQVTSDADAIAIAYGMLTRRSMKVIVRGARPSVVYKQFGLFRTERAKLDKDPEQDKLKRDAQRRFLETWRIRFVDGTGYGWHSALFTRKASGEKADRTTETITSKAVVLLNSNSTSARLVTIDEEAISPIAFNAGGEAYLRRIITAALAKPEEKEPVRGLRYINSEMDEMAAPARSMNPPLNLDYNSLFYSLRMQCNIGMQAALADFRRSLPEFLRVHTRAWPGSFITAWTASQFIMIRNGLSEQDCARMAQAAQLMPWLKAENHMFNHAETRAAILEGRPLAEVVKFAMGQQNEPHEKTLKSLYRAACERHRVNDIAGILDAMFSAEPHMPTLKRKDLEAVIMAASQFSNWRGHGVLAMSDQAKIVFCCRDSKRKLLPMPVGLLDVVTWLEKSLVQISANWMAGFNAKDAALDAICPNGRQWAAIDQTNRCWHDRQYTGRVS